MTNTQERVIKLLNEGNSPSEVSKLLKCNKSTISSIIKRFNIQNYKILNYNTCNHHYFDTVDNETKSYLLGLFVADGWIDNNRFGISILSSDSYILEHFKNVTSNKINVKNRTTNTVLRKDISTIRWSSNIMKLKFKEYNILQNKTYNVDFKFPFEKIQHNLIRHFIRGFIDGDGSFESNKGIFTITIVNTSFEFLKQIGEYFKTISDGIGYKISTKMGKTVNYYTLRINFNNINKPEKVYNIYKYLYSDSTIYFNRKKEKVESYLKYRGKL